MSLSPLDDVMADELFEDHQKKRSPGRMTRRTVEIRLLNLDNNASLNKIEKSREKEPKAKARKYESEPNEPTNVKEETRVEIMRS